MKHGQTLVRLWELATEPPPPYDLPTCPTAKDTPRIAHNSPKTSVNRPFRVFVNSTTSELGEWRALAAQVLQRKGIEVVHEQDFATHPRKPVLLPFGSLGPVFKGREGDLGKLEAHFLKEAFPRLPATPRVLTGLGGIGKTRLAIEYEFPFRESYQAILSPLPRHRTSSKVGWLGWPCRPPLDSSRIRNRTTLDESNLGKYLFEVRDRASNRMLYSRGFASIHGEWETTAEARSANRTFHESLRSPLPAAPVQVILKKRTPTNAFREIWTTEIDPKDMFVDTSTPSSPGPLLEIERNGDLSTKVDFLILGDGYTAAERPKFEADARRLTAALFATSPFKERRKDFNVWGLCPPANESGVSRPSTGIHRSSPIGATYDALGSERYSLLPAKNMPNSRVLSRARSTKPKATTVPSWIASCSPAPRSFARYAVGPSSESSNSTRNGEGSHP